MKKRNFWLLSLAALLLGVLVVPLLIPIPALADTVPPESLADDDSLFIDVNGLNVHYKIIGSGEPTFILLHGFGASLFSWHAVMPELAKYGTVVAYDRPAFGLTERPLEWAEGENPYSPQAQIEIVIGLMDALGIERAILIGNSAGGKVAFETALKYPARIQALVAVDAAVYAGGGAPPFIRPLLNTPQMNHLGALIARQIQKNGDDFIRSAWHDPSKITQETWDGYRKPLRTENWDKALWAMTTASAASDLAERLDELTLPVLVMTGDDDRIVPTEQSLRLAEELPNATLNVVAACGHLPHEEAPAAFMEALLEFLADLK